MAKRKYAYGFCDRTGFRYPLKDLVEEVQNGVKTGLRVGRDVMDPDHPQNYVGRQRADDPRPLPFTRPDNAADGLFGWGPVGNEATTLTLVGGTAYVTVE